MNESAGLMDGYDNTHSGAADEKAGYGYDNERSPFRVSTCQHRLDSHHGYDNLELMMKRLG